MITIKNSHRSVYLNTRQYSSWHMTASDDRVHLFVKESGRADEEYVLTYDSNIKLTQDLRVRLVSGLSDLITKSLSTAVPVVVDFKELLEECLQK